jgi:hypothetical protein
MMKLENKSYMLIPETRKLLFTQFAYIRTINNDFPSVLPVKRSQNLKQGCFTCSACPNNGHKFPFADIQVDSFQYLEIAISLGNVFCLNHFTEEQKASVEAFELYFLD